MQQIVSLFIVISLLALLPVAPACNDEADPVQRLDGPFDPYLHQKALDYGDWIRQWHTTGLGGVSDIQFTDETRTEILHTRGTGDSTDWTTFYLVSQCLRYRITGAQEALDEVERITRYLHLVHTVTQHPGYLARYVGYDEPQLFTWQLDQVVKVTRYLARSLPHGSEFPTAQ